MCERDADGKYRWTVQKATQRMFQEVYQDVQVETERQRYERMKNVMRPQLVELDSDAESRARMESLNLHFKTSEQLQTMTHEFALAAKLLDKDGILLERATKNMGKLEVAYSVSSFPQYHFVETYTASGYHYVQVE
ncbi:MAG: hypothetical protein H6765_09030 [Candidatus Peribacteria bacterium]|nr:MAG: hypothetical protein H6765_09030 [Candidatus Peribacteria bacterium]